MAPKAKAGAKGKAKAKAALCPPPLAAEVIPIAGPVEIVDEGDDVFDSGDDDKQNMTAKERRTLQRRDTNEAVGRIRQRRLSWVRDSALNGAINADGVSAMKFLRDAVHDHRVQKKNLKPEF